VTQGRKVGDVMMPEVRSVSPATSAREAAQVMREVDAGALPVVEGERVVGIVTDRDLALRVLGEGRGPETPIGEVATTDVVSVRREQDLDEALRVMARYQLRRLPVVEPDGRLVGIFAQADAAIEGSAEPVAEVVEAISEPPQAR
jgi:CBS domain-containing protein